MLSAVMKRYYCSVSFYRAVVIIALAVAICGCSIPRYTVGLDRVLYNEIGATRADIPEYRCTVGAHRGDSVTYMENSLGAFRAAVTNDRYAFIEFDVQYSSDDKIVVFHDKSLRRVFGKGHRIGASTFADLKELSGGEISAYNDVMNEVEGAKLNIEIKSQGDRDEDERLADYIVADVDARGIEDDVVISSISEAVVRYISRRYPKIYTGQIFFIKSSTYLPFDIFTMKLYDKIVETDADYLMLYVSNLHNINDLLAFKPKGKTIVFWDFDDTMYLVHKDLSDRIWGNSWLQTWFGYLRYKMRSSEYRTVPKK